MYALCKGFPTNPNPLDSSDQWPRYYFDTERMMLECEAWLDKRGYTPVDTESVPSGALTPGTPPDELTPVKVGDRFKCNECGELHTILPTSDGPGGDLLLVYLCRGEIRLAQLGGLPVPGIQPNLVEVDHDEKPDGYVNPVEPYRRS